MNSKRRTKAQSPLATHYSLLAPELFGGDKHRRRRVLVMMLGARADRAADLAIGDVRLGEHRPHSHKTPTAPRRATKTLINLGRRAWSRLRFAAKRGDDFLVRKDIARTNDHRRSQFRNVIIYSNFIQLHTGGALQRQAC
jgi:hypothetical protein